MKPIRSINNNLLIIFIIFIISIGLGLLNNANASSLPKKAQDPELRAALVNAVNSSDSFKDKFDAEVWLMDMSQRLTKRVPKTQTRIKLLKNIHYEAKRAELPPEMVLAVIEVESNFNPWAISVVGARGLMQIMPFWLKEIGRDGDNLFAIETNLRFGCTILKHYLKKEKGNWTRALARYNGSLGRFKYPNKVFKKLRKNWFRG